jgi:dihydrofolate reductase
MSVISHHTTSLDGFIAGRDDWMGWVLDYEEESRLLTETMARIGAVIAGRRWHDLAAERWDGVDGIYGGNWEGPVFVITHHPPEDADPRITFVSDGIEQAVAAAQSAAEGKDVDVFGASLTRQCLQAGLLDEVIVHVAPILLGGGIRLFGDESDQPVRLERVTLGEGTRTTDLRFRVLK